MPSQDRPRARGIDGTDVFASPLRIEVQCWSITFHLFCFVRQPIMECIKLPKIALTDAEFAKLIERAEAMDGLTTAIADARRKHTKMVKKRGVRFVPDDEEFPARLSLNYKEPRGAIVDLKLGAFGVQPEYDGFKTVYMDKAKRELSTFCKPCTNGYYKILEIGKALHSKGGVRLMMAFCHHVVPVRDHRTIDILWDGIGEWSA